MAKRIHLKDSDEPLKLGTDITANCGEIVKNALTAFTFDLGIIARPSGIGHEYMCRKCTIGGRRYLYGLYSGQQAMDQGNSQD